ncbi:hypothetical protein D5S17_13665 [Pseudonocardiaceae bacterium YIM PH 21723]|nr:hypothetical protein D5S17_13665 [Pseudonocardiaceae bacterium YIM PH 21723]
MAGGAYSRDLGAGEAMAGRRRADERGNSGFRVPGHRAAGSRRTVAAWPIALVVTLVVCTLGYVGYHHLSARLQMRAVAAQAGCVTGSMPLRIVVSPSIEDPIRKAVSHWNAEKTVVQDRCVLVEVTALDAPTVLQALQAGWDTAKLGPRPAAWIPESGYWTGKLDDSKITGSKPSSVAISPVVLAAAKDAGTAMQDKPFGWAQLPELAGGGWDRFGQPDWGAFTLGMPDPAANTASSLALQSMLAGDQTAVTPEQTQSPAVPKLATGTTGRDDLRTTLQNIADAESPTSSPYDVAPVLEVDLLRRNLGTDGGFKPGTPLAEILPTGPNVVADFPFVSLAMDDASGRLPRAATRFGAYLHEPRQQALFTGAGLRVPGSDAKPAKTPGLGWPALPATAPVADPAVADALHGVWAGAGSGSQSATLLVESSERMAADRGDGRPGLDWARDAVRSVTAKATTGRLGLWEFSEKLDGDHPYRPLVGLRSVAEAKDPVIGALDGLKAERRGLLTSAVLASYQTAAETYQPGSTNRLVVIADGFNSDSFLLDNLRQALLDVKKDDRPVHIDFLILGGQDNKPKLDAVAEVTGGSVTFTDGPGLTPALAKLLGQ